MKIIYCRGQTSDKNMLIWVKLYLNFNPNTKIINRLLLCKTLGIQYNLKFNEILFNIEQLIADLLINNNNSILIITSDFSENSYNFWKDYSQKHQIQFYTKTFSDNPIKDIQKIITPLKQSKKDIKIKTLIKFIKNGFS